MTPKHHRTTELRKGTYFICRFGSSLSEKFISNEQHVRFYSRHCLIYHERSWRKKESGKAACECKFSSSLCSVSETTSLFFKLKEKLPSDVICHAQVRTRKTIKVFAHSYCFLEKSAGWLLTVSICSTRQYQKFFKIWNFQHIFPSILLFITIVIGVN